MIAFDKEEKLGFNRGIGSSHHRCIFVEQLTPVLAYRCLVKEDDLDSPSFLFEFVEPCFKTSAVGANAKPMIEITAKENKVTVMEHVEGRLTEEVVEDPMLVPRRISKHWQRPQFIEDLPDAFCGGWVAYFSYDTVRYIEKKKLSFASAPPDDRNLPDIHLGLYNDVVVFDHVQKASYAVYFTGSHYGI